jgi:pimeloyl-ACP methyl ester carboxylesterase
VHLVAVDRPAFGGSDLQPGRRLEHWPLDVAELADALGFESFAVVAYSAGGPYALACAALLGERAPRAGLVSTTARFLFRDQADGVAELDDEDVCAVQLVEQMGREKAAQSFAADQADWARRIAEEPQRFFEGIPVTDQNRWFREDPERMASFLGAVAEALRQGSAGGAWERVIAFEAFPVPLDAISVDVHLWHGRFDVLAPLAPAELLASRIPNCRVTIWPDEGHIAIARHWDEILEALAF